MLNLLIFTIIMWCAGNAILKLFHIMIQPGQILDMLLGWQKMLKRLYAGSTRQQLLEKMLGGCEHCTAFWFMPMWYIVYWLMSKNVLHYWISDNILVNIVWYVVFHSIGAVTGVFVLAFKKKK